MTEATIRTVKRNTLALSLLFAATASLHFVRDVWFAKHFGTGIALEAFELVFVLPSMMARFFGGGMLPAIVPRSVGLIGDDGIAPAFWRLHVRLLWHLGAIVLAAVAVLILFAPSCVGLLAAAASPESAALALSLFRPLVLSLVLSVAIGVAMAAAHALQQFTWTAAAGLLGPAAFLVVLVLYREHGIQAAPWAFFCGQALVLAALLLLLRARRRAPLAVSAPLPTAALALQTTGSIGLVLLGWLSGVANLQIDLSMAASLGEGAVPSLRYAYRWVQLPAGLFFSTVGVVLLPALSRALVAADEAARDRTLRFACRSVAAVLLPAACGLWLLAPDLIQILYERGAFLASDTTRTASVLRAYAPSIVAFGYLNVALSTLHAHRQQRVAAWIGLVTIAGNAGLNLVLMRWIGVPGIALSTSLLIAANAFFIMLARPELRALLRRADLAWSFLRALLASGAMALAVWGLRTLTIEAPIRPIVLLALYGAFGVVVYVLALAALRGNELRELRGAMQRREPAA